MRIDSDTIPAVFRLERLKGHDLNEITIEQLQRLFSKASTDRLTSVEYVRYCLDRIRKVRTPLTRKAVLVSIVNRADVSLQRSTLTSNASSKSIQMLQKLLRSWTMSDSGGIQEGSFMAYPSSSKMWVQPHLGYRCQLRVLEHGHKRQDANNGWLVGFVR